ncbi:Uncharacterized membrane protein [Devosia enhydra]|uniref:Uncharacterized membrane protein n=1 Tax=Devosia enhydra TaxID=665118 RepID=A0A1K2I2V6_9HYPH|nr:DUF599 domain-containing protein [Devosia enhydra]SFZ86575.1 Uncharacterized membrane protein [Devosia enhydra]
MTLFASLFPLLCWFAYNWGIGLIEKRVPSLSVIMSMQRRRWVVNASRRESPLDAILSGNLMGSVSFLASTSVLLVLAVFTAFGQMEGLLAALDGIGLPRSYSVHDVQVQFLVMLALFVGAFFAFTLALRQFNHFCIMIGAMDHRAQITDAEIDAITRLNAMGAQNFNNGIRAYYFAVATIAWFAADWAAIATTLVTVGFLVHREFFSTARSVAAAATLIAARRDAEMRAPAPPAELPTEE